MKVKHRAAEANLVAIGLGECGGCMHALCLQLMLCLPKLWHGHAPGMLLLRRVEGQPRCFVIAPPLRSRIPHLPCLLHWPQRRKSACTQLLINLECSVPCKSNVGIISILCGAFAGPLQC